MDKIQILVDTFSEEDKKEFRIFINRQKIKKERKDLDLFELLCQQLPPKEIQQKLYKTPNKVAYHTLRKRLFKHLTEFIVLKQIDNDTSAVSSISGMVSLAIYLFDKKSDELAWRILTKAESLADENEQHKLLDTIYHIQFEKAHNNPEVDLDELLNKWKKNKVFFDEDERANIAYSFIIRELNQIKLKGDEIDVEKVIDRVLKQYELENVIQNRPSILYKVLDITRKVMLSRKDFLSFEEYIIEKYEELLQNHGFSKRHHYYKVNLLYMISHALYRNRKFNKSNEYLKRMLSSMNEHKQMYYQQFFPKYILLNAANLTYLGENELSIQILENIDEQIVQKMPIEEQLNIQLNLCVYYFNSNFWKKANNVFQQMGHTDKWMEKKMGKEWILKKNLIDIIIQYELGNVDIVLNRIRAFERSFKPMFDQPIYQRVALFIKMIKTLVDSPQIITTDDFKEHVYATIVNIPREQEDLQAMAFYSWLKSKMVKEDYYKVLLEVVHS